jgi:hypothetical protein
MSKNRSGVEREEVSVSRTMLMPIKHRVIPYLTPWAVGLVTLPLGAALHWKANSPLMMVVVTACAGILTWATYRLWDRRHTYTQLLATAYAGALALWLVVTAAVGVAPLLTPWAVAWVMTSLLWNIRVGSLNVTNKHDKMSGDPETAWAPIRSLKGVKTKSAKLIKDETGLFPKVRIRLQHPPGKSTTADVQDVRDKVAARFAVGTDDVTVRSVRGRADQTDIEVRKDNPTKKVVSWTGLHDAGKSISDAPVLMGVRSGGGPFAVWIVGDDEVSRPLPHTIVSGMNGSGKSEAMIVADLEIRARTDALTVVANPVKFQIDFGDIADMYPIAAEGDQQTRQLIDNLPEAGEYRAWLIGKHGYKQWEPELYTRYGIPLVMIRIEEASSVITKNTAFKRATETFRALGMPLVVSMQVAVFRNIEREARSQFANSIAFGVSDMQDAKFVLTDQTLSAGADPTMWKNNEPGRCYGELTGFPPEMWPEDARVFKVTRAQKRAAIDATRPHWAQLDAGTAARLGKGIFVPDSSVTAPVRGLSVVPDLSKIAKGPADTGDRNVNLNGYVDRDKSEDTTVPFGMIHSNDPSGRMETPDVRELIEATIDDLERDRSDGIITPKDFDQVVTISGRKPQWIYYELDRWVKRGRLEDLDGKPRRWRILPLDQAQQG